MFGAIYLGQAYFGQAAASYQPTATTTPGTLTLSSQPSGNLTPVTIGAA